MGAATVTVGPGQAMAYGQSHHGARIGSSRPRVPRAVQFVLLLLLAGWLIWHLVTVWRGTDASRSNTEALLQRVEHALPTADVAGADRASTEGHARATRASAGGTAGGMAGGMARLVVDLPAEAVPEGVLADTGLCYEVYAPELAGAMGQAGAGLFCVNGVASLRDSARIATHLAEARPQLARRVLDFALNRLPDLKLEYDIRTGRAIQGRDGRALESDLATEAALVRLAVALNDAAAHHRLMPRLHRRLRAALRTGTDTDGIREAQAALEASLAWDTHRQTAH